MKNNRAGKRSRQWTQRVETNGVTDLPIMPTKCSTCPFHTDENGRHLHPELVAGIQKRILSHCSQICHHPKLHGREETHLCRGARDYQQIIFYCLGFVEAPTDEAWQRRVEEMKLRGGEVKIAPAELHLYFSKKFVYTSRKFL